MTDYLAKTNYRINQSELFYHFNGDTVLLGSFLEVRHDDDVFDIGCACGALLLYAAQGKPHSLEGIDLFEEVTDEAMNNLRLNHVNGAVHTGRVQDFAPDHKNSYTLIICNPPYCHTDECRLLNKNKFLAAARHETYLSLDELFEAAGLLLRANGRLALVHRAFRLPEIILRASEHGFKLRRMRPVYNRPGGTAVSVLLEFCVSGHLPQMKMEPPSFLAEQEDFSDRGDS